MSGGLRWSDWLDYPQGPSLFIHVSLLLHKGIILIIWLLIFNEQLLLKRLDKFRAGLSDSRAGSMEERSHTINTRLGCCHVLRRMYTTALL
jgi:hypothetical protein